MKKTVLVISLLLPMCLFAQQGRVEASWQSLNQRGYPQWFSDARLGIFVHWGLYSVPAYASKEGYAEWFYRGLMTGDTARRRIMSLYADTILPVFEQYATLTKYWHGELWQPDEWARLFREAGAKYVMLVTKHHDGYCLWDSPQQPEWNSTVSGPHRNIVAELTYAVRKQGLRMGFYYSLPEWSNSRHIWMEDPDDSIADYVDNYMVPQFKDLVSRYRPDAIFTDGDWQNTAKQFHAEELISWYYNTVGPDAIVNDRWGKGTQHGFKTPEYSAGISYQGNRPWAECRGIGRSFGYNRNEDIENYLTDRQLIQHFVELVADGGGLTLNVGPMADGTISYIQQERLRNLGQWLKINGEAIYGSEPPDVGVRCKHVRPVKIVERINKPLPVSDAIDFDWVRNSPDPAIAVDGFNVIWEGSVTAPANGIYTFKTEADDEITVVYGNDTLLYYNKAWAENDRAQKTLRLKKGQTLKLKVHFYEKDLEASARLLWSTDSKDFTPVPAAWSGTAQSLRTNRCYTQRGNALYIHLFECPSNQIEEKLSFMLSKDAIVRMLGTQTNLKWKQDEDGLLTIDLSDIPADKLNGLNYVWVIKIDKYNTHF
ncbi:MAG: alpha-L-fucosidase [Bacteroidales bacterium]|nr:alpha-L-fucosidase [Bacteroidales bacterium]